MLHVKSFFQSMGISCCYVFVAISSPSFGLVGIVSVDECSSESASSGMGESIHVLQPMPQLLGLWTGIRKGVDGKK